MLITLIGLPLRACCLMAKAARGKVDAQGTETLDDEGGDRNESSALE